MFGRGLKLFTVFGIPVYLDVSFFLIVPIFAFLISWQLPVYANATGMEREVRELFQIQTETPAVEMGQAIGEQLRERGIQTTNEEAGEIYRDASREVGQPIQAENTVGRSGLALLFGVLVALGLYVSVLVHEFGHALTARPFGVKTDRVTLWFLGGVASFERMPRQPGAEAIVAIAGPLVSFAVAGILALIFISLPQDLVLWRLIVGTLSVINLVLAIFNLLPALPLDGGRVLRSLLALKLPYVRATQISASIAKGLALLLVVVGLLGGGGLMLVAIAIFIYFAVNAETRQATVEQMLRGVKIGDLMVRNVSTVPATMPVGELLSEMIRRRHLGFPVLDETGRTVGVVGLRDLPEGFDPNQPVSSVMRSPFCQMPADTPAEQAFNEMGQNGFARCVVVDAAGRLQGLVTKSDLIRLIQVRSAAVHGQPYMGYGSAQQPPEPPPRTPHEQDFPTRTPSGGQYGPYTPPGGEPYPARQP